VLQGEALLVVQEEVVVVAEMAEGRDVPPGHLLKFNQQLVTAAAL
jgi:hypothetical protein